MKSQVGISKRKVYIYHFPSHNEAFTFKEDCSNRVVVALIACLPVKVVKNNTYYITYSFDMDLILYCKLLCIFLDFLQIAVCTKIHGPRLYVYFSNELFTVMGQIRAYQLNVKLLFFIIINYRHQSFFIHFYINNTRYITL